MGIVLIGLVMGIFSGLAIGGGTILIPALVFLYGTEQHMAQGLTLASFIPTSIVAIYTHWKQKNVLFHLALYLAIGSMAGAAFGSFLAVHLSAEILKKVFGIFLMLMGLRLYLSHDRQANKS